MGFPASRNPLLPSFLCVQANGKVKATFKYTRAFNSVNPEDDAYASQQAIYDVIGKQILDNAFEGYNACLLAYGQTGSSPC